MEGKYGIVGKSVRKVDGFEKVTGEAKYVDDISFPNMLHAAILKSPYAHARIISIDASKAEKLPGVKAVISGRDAAEIFFKKRGKEDYLRWDRNCVMSIQKVRYIGDPIAAVAAIDKDIAFEALELIEVEYEVLPAVFSPQEALMDGAPLLHEGRKSNIGTHFKHEFGNVEQGLTEAYYIREDTSIIPPMAHVCMEPRGTIAKYDSGKLTLWTSHQSVYVLRNVLAKTLGMDESKIRVIKPYTGSGFGGKCSGVAHLPILELFPNDFCAALLAIKTGRPVKLVLTREEEFSITRLSQPMIIKLRTGVRKDGTIVAKDIEILIDGGAYDSPIGAGVNYLSSIWLTLPYKQDNFRFDIKRVFTNKPISGALRGYAARETLFAQETHMDRLANDIGIDPADLRLKNLAGSSYVTPNGLKVTTCGLRECIEKVIEKTNWREKKSKLPHGRGIGMAICGFGSGTSVSLLDAPGRYTASCTMRLTHLGEVIIYTGLADIGQGSDTVMCQIAAEELGLDTIDDVKIISADTDLCPPDAGTFSSKGTVHGGWAVKEAAHNLKQKLFELIGRELGVNPTKLECKEGIIYNKENPSQQISFKEAIRTVYEKEKGREIVASGVYQPPLPETNFYVTGVGNFAPNYSFGAQSAEVEVDEETGEVKVSRIVYAHDIGYPINPRLVEGQLEGAVVMAMGGALCEEVEFDAGRFINPNLADYNIPRAPEIPKIEVVHVITDDPNGPFGAKECGEGTTSGTAPAIANAVYDVLGIMVDLPLTKEKILKALEEQKREREIFTGVP